jgi:hypothetical protein
MSLWLLELRSTDFNGPVLCRGFSVSAGQRIVETTLGVKGSQVQILSSRRSRGFSQVRHCEGPLFWILILPSWSSMLLIDHLTRGDRDATSGS